MNCDLLRDNLVEIVSASQSKYLVPSPFSDRIHDAAKGWGIVYKIIYVCLDNFLNTTYEEEKLISNIRKTVQAYQTAERFVLDESASIHQKDKEAKKKFYDSALVFASFRKVLNKPDLLKKIKSLLNKYIPDPIDFMVEETLKVDFFRRLIGFEEFIRFKIPLEMFKELTKPDPKVLKIFSEFSEACKKHPLKELVTEEDHQVYRQKVIKKFQKLVLRYYPFLMGSRNSVSDENYFLFIKNLHRFLEPMLIEGRQLEFIASLALDIGKPLQSEIVLDNFVFKEKQFFHIQDLGDRGHLLISKGPLYMAALYGYAESSRPIVLSYPYEWYDRKRGISYCPKSKKNAPFLSQNKKEITLFFKSLFKYQITPYTVQGPASLADILVRQAGGRQYFIFTYPVIDWKNDYISLQKMAWEASNQRGPKYYENYKIYTIPDTPEAHFMAQMVRTFSLKDKEKEKQLAPLAIKLNITKDDYKAYWQPQLEMLEQEYAKWLLESNEVIAKEKLNLFIKNYLTALYGSHLFDGIVPFLLGNKF